VGQVRKSPFYSLSGEKFGFYDCLVYSFWGHFQQKMNEKLKKKKWIFCLCLPLKMKQYVNKFILKVMFSPKEMVFKCFGITLECKLHFYNDNSNINNISINSLGTWIVLLKHCKYFETILDCKHNACPPNNNKFV
jgi:hypothetical protein